MPKTKTTIDYLAQLEKDMVLVEKGSFMMGSNEDEKEKPIHEVTFEQDFYMCKYPVTQGLWKFVMREDIPFRFKGDTRPVENVSWNHIIQFFLPNLNILTGKNYRLPSEAEWEYAARGGKNGSHSLKYSGSDSLKEVGWFYGNSHNETKPVGLKKSNELGLYDMRGNVWEWCQDEWQNDYKNVLTDGSARNGNNEGNKRRVVRGGSRGNSNYYCRVSYRSYNYTDYRFNDNGFRVAQD